MATIDTNQVLGGLEEDGAWLHGLARSLCRDPERARDAAQETILTAMEKPPQGGAKRPWLARVLRNRLSEDWRKDLRRSEREQRRAAPDERPSADQTLARLELQETVAAAVRALEEPYRTAIVLRYLDGLPPRRVAAQLGIPIKTVKSRLERGIAKLRARLDREFGGDRSAWMRALLALPIPPLTTGILTGVSAMGLGTKIGMSTAVIAAIALGSSYLGHGSRSPLEVEPVLADEMPNAPSIEAREPRLLGGISQAQRQADGAPFSPQEDLTPSSKVVGLVVDPGGEPLEGVRVGLRRERSASSPWIGEPVKSMRDGTFALELPEEPAGDKYNRLVFDSADPHWSALRREVAPLATGASTNEPKARRLVVAPARRVEGRVIDNSGMPLAAVQLRIELPIGLRRSIDTGQQAATSPAWISTSDTQGRFSFERIPEVEHLNLLSRLGGFEPREFELERQGTVALKIELTRLSAGEQTVAGRVLGPDGLPMAGALVSAGEESMTTGASGWFAVQLPPVENRAHLGSLTLRAVAQGLQPAEVPLDLELDPQPFLELSLSGNPLAISGHVDGIRDRGPAGNLRQPVYVWANGIAPFGMTKVSIGGTEFETFTFLEEHLTDLQPPLGAASARVDEDGNFRIDGLRDKSYTLFAFDSSSLRVAGPLEVQAGASGVQMALREEPAPIRVQGRVLNGGGQPVEGVTVSASRELEIESHHFPGGPSVRTDADGRFSFDALSFFTLELYVSNPSGDSDIAEGGFDFDRSEVSGELQLVVGRKCRLRVMTDDPLLVEANLWIEDEDGNALALEMVDGGTTMLSGGTTLTAGNSGILYVEDRARQVVLEDASGEQVRVPVELTADGINEVSIN